MWGLVRAQGARKQACSFVADHLCSVGLVVQRWLSGREQGLCRRNEHVPGAVQGYVKVGEVATTCSKRMPEV